MADISLNAGIRSNLLQLQSSSKLFDRTTERLGSGKKVNSAIDNPTNFFASVNLTDRADGLSARLDSMGQAIQRIQAADNGITTIRSFISAMKGVVNNALGNTDADARDALGRQFNELIVQVAEAAKDSSYQGVNLLQNSETETVQFNETFDASVLEVKGFNLEGPGGNGRADASGNVASAAITANIVQVSAASVAATASVASVSATVASTASAAGTASAAESAYLGTAGTFTNASQTVTLAGETGYTASNAAATAAIGTASVASTASAAGVTATVASVASAASVAAVASAATSAVAVALATQDGTQVGIKGANSAGGTGMIDWGGSTYKDDLAGVIQQLEAFDEELKTQASNLSQNLATITIREDFSNELINTLTEGADKLTLADLNEEGANLLALQTSQALATQSLALASQQSQGVLQLLG